MQKEYSILQQFPKETLNNTTVKSLGNSNHPIEVFPPEIFFKDIEPHQNYEVTVTVRNISKKVRRIKFSQPKTNQFKCDYEMQGPVAAGLPIKMNVSFETEVERDFHDVIEITTEGHKDPIFLHLHALKPGPDIQFEPLVNFKFIPINSKKTETIEFKNEGKVQGHVDLGSDAKKNGELQVEPKKFTLEPDEIKKVQVTLTATEPDFIMKLIEVHVEQQDKPRYIEITATSVEHHLSVVFEEGGGQKSALNFGTLYMGEQREYPAFIVNNGPKPAQFSFKFLQGLRNLDDNLQNEEENVVSPHQAGKELTERVLTAEPLSGEVQAYAQLPIKFICRTKKYEKLGGFSDHTKESEQTSGIVDGNKQYRIPPVEHASMAMILFKDQSHESLRVQMMARACYPEVKINRQSFQFGECKTNDSKNFILTIKNKNEDLPLDFAFTKVAQFHAIPSKGKLLPATEHSINISFEPKNFGVFNTQMDLEILGSIYKFPLKLMGVSSQIGKRNESPEKKFITDYEADYPPAQTMKKKNKGLYDVPKWMEDSTLNIDEQLERTDLRKDEKQHWLEMKQKQSKFQSTKFLKDQRVLREKERKIEEKMKATNKPPPQTLDEIENDIDKGMDWNLEPPKLTIPKEVDRLYVEKPIGEYEPMVQNQSRKRETQDLTGEQRIMKKKYKEQPTTQAEQRDCEIQLNGEQLQKVTAGPQRIDFGTVFVKSITTKNFVVTNDLRQHIQIKLKLEGIPELAESFPKSQVIPPGFLVQANAEPVALDLSKKVLKFIFPDDNTDMSISETINITNNGNADAKIQWSYNAHSGLFIPSPAEDKIPARSTKTAKITFTPNGPKPDDELITLKIVDGTNVDIKCIGIVNETKCNIIEKVLDFGNVPVGIKSKEEVFNIKNGIRQPCVFQVQCDSEELTIHRMRGKIKGEDKAMINVSFLSNIEKEFNSTIMVNIRGGKPIPMPIKANAIIPDVKILQENFDFSGVTFGDSKVLPLTIHNYSNIEAKLILDLREYPEFEIIMDRQQEIDDAASDMMVPITDEIDYNDMDEVNPEDIKDPLEEDDDNEEEEEEDENAKRYVLISLKPERSPLNLEFKYTPCDVDEPRNFDIPFKLKGVGEIEGLFRNVKGVGVKPRFLLDPHVVDFKTKVIAKGSKPLPFHNDIKISNPDHNPITWSVDRQVLEDSKVYSMNPTEGRLEPGTTSTVRVTFNPLEPQEYAIKVPLILDGDKEKPYLMIEFRGEGAEAKIYFDRREIILPVVPLGFPAKATFQVCHNGYENLELRPKIATEVGKLPITLNFTDGRNLGVTKQKLKVEAVFINKKPLSFTTHIDFYDDEGNKFSIPISGTTDNCLNTIFPFMQRNQEEIQLEVEPGKPIMLIQDATSDNESGKTGGIGKPFSKGGASSVISRTARSLVGYNPVASNILEKNCEYISRWFSTTMHTSNMQNFPLDIINQNGSQVYELIYYLSGKRPPGQIQKGAGGTSSTNTKDNLKALLVQYEELINFLKVNGAHLNTVRPEYLLSIADYSKYLKMNPKEENMKPKTVDLIFPYLQSESWMTIFYQILKIYYLNRVTQKSFRTLPGMTLSDTVIDNTMTSSNVYSLAETILLKWLTYHYNKVNNMHPKNITNFDADLHDGLVIAALIKSHYGNAKNVKEMKPVCYSEEQVIFNAKKVIEAVSDIGLQTHLTPQDLANPSARELLLFVVQLYQGLPHYIPKANIEFPAVLGDLVTKNIELSNPSKNPISYWVKLEGSSDFSCEEDSVRIEPGTTVNYPIKFQSRISNPVTGKIIFTNKKEGNVQAAAMVFELVSNVYERNSIEKIERDAKLYKSVPIDIEIHNPFNQDVTFTIQIIYEKSQKNPQKKGNSKQSTSMTSDKNKKGQTDSNTRTTKNANTVPDPFSCKLDSIKVRKNQTTTVPVLFLPFELGVHKCYVVFSDETAGELQYTLIGKAGLPEYIETFSQQCNAEETFIFKSQLNVKNEKLESAKQQVLDKATLQKQKEQAQNQMNEGKGGKQLAPDQKYFEIELSNPFFTGPSSVILYDQSRQFQKQGQPNTPKGQGQGQGQRSNQMTTEQNMNMLELTCNPTKPATYTCLAFLKSLDRTDIRIYEYKLTAIPQKIKAQLEFRVPARGQVLQDIPIVNNSSKEWNVSAALEPQKIQGFNLNRTQIQVKKGAVENFVLSFKPTWVCNITGVLTLTNKTTGEVYEYELKGIGEEPLAEEHIILNCIAKKKINYPVKIENKTDKVQEYQVMTDLQNAEGPPSFKVNPRSIFEYPLSITPLLGGVYTASITFFDQENRFMWYTVEVRTDSPRPEDNITLKSFIRKANSAEISLSNPLNEPITFEVFYSGDGLIGEGSFQIDANQVGVYTLIYSPLMSGENQGTIGFLNEKVGEFWYDLTLVAEENPPLNLELLECELGKVASHFIQLENPTGQELLLDYRNSNPTNFEVIPEKILLPPYEQQKVCIQYSPSNLDIVESGTMIFESPQVGKWEYNLEGKGLLPTLMEPQPISTAVGNNTSSMLSFKNPFREQANVNIVIETEDTKIFSLLLKKNKFNIGPLGILQVPFSFSPQTMTESKATIVISMSKQLIWRYPLRGIAESASSNIDYHFKTRARKPYEETLKIHLPGFEDLNPSGDTFRYEINVSQPNQKGFIERSVFFEQKNERLQGPGDPLVFLMRFEPLRPFKSNCEFIVYKSSGGRWKFNLIFESLDPDVDDIIIIQSPLHKTSSVSFKLTNHMRTFAEFNSYFTPDSAPEFVVYPKTGLLESYGKEGTNFVVSFTPTEYGKAKIGKLVIQTDEMQWTYEIRGSHPQYKIPEPGGGRINNKLSKEALNGLKHNPLDKKNFLVENKKTNKYAQHSPGKSFIGASIANVSQRGPNKSRVGGGTTAGGGRELSQERSAYTKQ